MGIKAALAGLFSGAKAEPSYLVQMVPRRADGFMPALQFSGSDLTQLMTQAVWAYVCIRRLGEDVASLPAVVQTYDEASGEWIPDREHQLNDVILKPWGPGPRKPRQGWPWLMEMTSYHHDIAGTALYRKRYAEVISKKTLLALQLLPPPPKTTGVPTQTADGWDNLEYWQLIGGETLLPSDSVAIIHADPGSTWRGLSPLVAAEQPTAIDWYSQRRIKYNLEQRIGAGMVMKVKGIFQLSTEKRAATMTAIEELHAAAEASGRPLVVGDAASVEGMPEQSTLADIPAHRLEALREVAGIFHIPLLVLGFADRGEYKDLDSALAGYWTLGLWPKLEVIYNSINAQGIWPHYGTDVRIWYDLTRSPLGLALLRIQAKAAEDLMKLGYPANDVNRRVHLGMPYHDELAVPNMPAVVAGRGQPGRPETEPAQPPALPEPEDE